MMVIMGSNRNAILMLKIPICPSVIFIVDKVKGPELKLNRVTRADMGAYLCIAANGIPPAVSKRIMVHVQCK